MLLRRITEHVKDQNWFAVCIDFFIVVIGVFIGIQVANWNTARIETVQEVNYLNRIHQELSDAQKTNALVISFKQIVQDRLADVFAALDDEPSLLGLTPQECSSIYFSHIFDEPFPTLPTMTELLSSGRLSIISSDKLRSILVEHEQALRAASEYRIGYQIDRVVLTSKYPDLIRLGTSLSELSIQDPTTFFGDMNNDAIECDLQGMRASNGFRNDLIDNAGRHHEYLRAVVEQQEMLGEIRGQLDEKLSIGHRQNE